MNKLSYIFFTYIISSHVVLCSDLVEKDFFDVDDASFSTDYFNEISKPSKSIDHNSDPKQNWARLIPEIEKMSFKEKDENEYEAPKKVLYNKYNKLRGNYTSKKLQRRINNFEEAILYPIVLPKDGSVADRQNIKGNGLQDRL